MESNSEVHRHVHQHVRLTADVEADSAEEAFEKADKVFDGGGLCHQCARWKATGADRRAVADRLGVDCHIDAIIPAIRRLQVRAEDADAAAAALTEVGVPPGRDMTLADAIRTLADTPVDIPAPDASDPAHVRFAAVVCDAAGVHTAVTKNAVTSVGAWLRALADRLGEIGD